VGDAGFVQPRTDDFQQSDKLAEHERLVAFLAQFLDALEEGVEFRAGQRGVRRIDQRGMTADLAQPQEAREDVEAHFVERAIGLDAEELGARALEFRVVKLPLLAL
jgi:hypothetical protein